MKVIQGQKWYRPMEIAEQGLIQNSKGAEGTVAGHYHFVLELIKSDQLKAAKYSKRTRGSKPYWLVCETEIDRYHAEVES